MIEVGEYIRTKNGIIFKVDKEKKNIQINEFMNIGGNRDIKTHSKDIIDLIEVGDFVGNCEIEYITKNENGETLLMNSNVTLKEKNINTIVTKEQFNSVMYKVGDIE